MSKLKKVFLTSVACNILDKFAKTFNCNPKELTVAFIPTAADVYENKFFVDDDRNKLLKLGFKVIEINIAGQTKKDLEKQLSNVDVIFVSGGNTFYLLEKAIESGFDKIVKKLVNKGVYYIGSSAGSALAGVTIEPIKFLDEPKKAKNLKTYNGLKLIDAVILPHYGNVKYQTQMDKIISKYPALKDKMVTLNDYQALVCNNDNWKIISN